MYPVAACRPRASGGRASVGGGLTAGALAVWNFSDYNSTNDNPIVKNSLSAVDIFSNQMMRQSTRISTANTINWIGTATSGNTKDYYANVDGKVTASRVTVTSATPWLIYQILKAAYAVWTGVGNYTVACDVRLVSGDGKFKFVRPFGGEVYGTEKTATGSWARYSQTFTNPDIPYFGIGHDSPSGDTVLEIDHCCVYPGNSDLGRETFVGHIRIGDSGEANLPNYAGGVLTCDARRMGYAQFDEAHFGGAGPITVYAKVKALTGAVEDYQVWFSNPQPSDEDSFVVGTNVTSNGFGVAYGPGGGGSVALGGTVSGGWPATVPTDDFHVWAHVFDGTTLKNYLDGVLLYSGVPSGSLASSVTIKDLIFNVLVSHKGSFAYKNLALYEAALTEGQILSDTAYLQSLP